VDKRATSGRFGVVLYGKLLTGRQLLSRVRRSFQTHWRSIKGRKKWGQDLPLKAAGRLLKELPGRKESEAAGLRGIIGDAWGLLDDPPAGTFHSIADSESLHSLVAKRLAIPLWQRWLLRLCTFARPRPHWDRPLRQFSADSVPIFVRRNYGQKRVLFH